MRYRFGNHVLDPMTMRLTYKGIELDVPRRVHGCLSYLIEHRERVVNRDELIHKVWNRDNVSDHQLAQLIRAARNTLGDDGNSQNMIRTVMGVGYHWGAEIVEIAPQAVPSYDPEHDDFVRSQKPLVNKLPLVAPPTSLVNVPVIAAGAATRQASEVECEIVQEQPKPQVEHSAPAAVGFTARGLFPAWVLTALLILMLAWQVYAHQRMSALSNSLQTTSLQSCVDPASQGK